ncbi:Glycosyltransferase-like KOBITO 1 [Trebouxia sp. C0010 RCD-2024]
MAPDAPKENKMIYNHLGNTGLRVSALSYGAWVTFGTQVDVEQAKKLMTQCRDAGVNFFDNAEVYAGGKAEEVMGQAIKEMGWKRSDYVVSTKIFWGGSGPNDKGLSRKHVIEGTKAALKRFQLEYVDLVFCHRPDVYTPIEETVRAMNFVIEQGWAFYWGTSEWSAQQITEAWECANKLGLIGPAMEQPQYNMFEREKIEKEFLPCFKRFGTGTTIWSPLASGVLSGKYSKGNIPPDSRLALEAYKGLKEKSLVDETLEKVDALKPIAEGLGATLAQLALAWCARNPHVSTVIMGATKQHQLEDNLKAIELVPKLTQEVMDKIDTILKNKPEPASTYGR